MKPEHLDEALQHMAPIISHEIRNPMAVIKNSAYFVKSKLEKLEVEDEKITRHLGIVESELQRADAVLGELLFYARMKTPTPAAATWKDLVDMAVRDVVLEEGVTIECAHGDDELSVTADAELMTRALMHLVRNAAEAADLAEKDKKVVIESGKDGKDAYLSVTDHGPGIKKEFASKLFLPFATDKPRGVGLGLAYTKKVMTIHKGKVEYSGKGGATVFRVSVPAL